MKNINTLIIEALLKFHTESIKLRGIRVAREVSEIYPSEFSKFLPHWHIGLRSGYKLKIPLTLLLILQTDINCKNMGWKQANSSWKMGERQAIWRKVAILNRSFQKSYNLPFQIFFYPNFSLLIIDKRSEIINMIFTISVSHPTLPFQVLAWLFFCFFYLTVSCYIILK